MSNLYESQPNITPQEQNPDLSRVHNLVASLIPFSFDHNELSESIMAKKNETITALYNIYTDNKVKYYQGKG